MIKVDGVVKRFGNFTALNNISFEIQSGSIYGLVGINGAGKSTLLRTVAGIYVPEEGHISFDGIDVFDNPEVKAKIAFVPDELYLPNGTNMKTMAKKYELLYHGRFNENKFLELSRIFELDITKPFNTFSKGMRRQASTILAVALETEYIFFDETFDGLDPFKRGYIKRLISEDVRSRGATAIITSHSLKELEDTCDRLAVLDKGGLVFESDIRELSCGGLKVQIAFAEDYTKDKFSELDVIDFSKHGSVASLIIRGDEEQIKTKIEAMSPILFEVLPLSLEELFTFELDKLGVNTFKEKKAHNEREEQ